MKTKTTSGKLFRGILSDSQSVIESCEKAGLKARILWQFGEPVEVEEGVEDFSAPLLNATVNEQTFFYL
jgi:hypothetical protein